MVFNNEEVVFSVYLKTHVMKNLLYLVVVLFIVQGCKKDKSNPGPDKPDPSYINVADGSQWTYHQINSSDGAPVESDYTITSTSKDTSVNSQSYHVYTYSFGGSQYLGKSDGDYYQFTDFAQAGQAFAWLYLKSNAQVNANWSQNESITDPGSGISIPIKVNNVVTEIGARTVNGISYENVVHVKTTLSSSLIPADNFKTDVNSYYASAIGLIENTTSVDIDYMGFTLKVNVQTTLKSVSLK